MRPLLSFLLLFALALPSHADGLLLPADDRYPADLLRNRVTEIRLTVHGMIAETVVYQEFVNEWDRPVDATYSFPLPADARATLLLYTRNDTTFRAVLKVQEQAPNPGTGEGGLGARVNAYIGRNGLKLPLEGIAPGAIQTVELHYISVLDYHRGLHTYRYPLDTRDFVQHPVDHLSFTADVRTNAPITGFDVPTHEGVQVLRQDETHLELRLRRPKAYLAEDLVFRFQTGEKGMNVDFYAAANDTTAGHFALFVRPENHVEASALPPRRFVFAINNSSRMAGGVLQQSLQAVSDALGTLSGRDQFNILLFNTGVVTWRSGLVPATSTNIDEARRYLDGVTGQFGNRMDVALQRALEQFTTGGDFSDAVLVFTDGRSPISPEAVAAANVTDAGIFPIGLGDDLDRSRLELTAARNHGFVTYLEPQQNIREALLRVFDRVSQPVLQNPVLDFGRGDVARVFPGVLPAVYAGTAFMVTGRYTTPGTATLQLAGRDSSGARTYTFPVTFSEDKYRDRFVALLWAKEAIDALEREIDVYGETAARKDSVIALSLRYNIRSRYTAYIADYETVYTGVDEDPAAVPPAAPPGSYVAGSYPNPFDAFTTFRVFIDAADAGQPRFLRIYNVLGQLVAVINLSDLPPGWHEIRFEGADLYGRQLPAGLYLVRLDVGGRVAGTVGIHRVR